MQVLLLMEFGVLRSHLITMGLSFVICKMGIMSVLISESQDECENEYGA